MVIITSVPKKSAGLKPIPFKLIYPRELDPAQAKPVWEALEANGTVVLADPFALPGVSTVFPGVLYANPGTSFAAGLKQVAALVDPVGGPSPEDLADGWVELWVTEALADAAVVEV